MQPYDDLSSAKRLEDFEEAMIYFNREEVERIGRAGSAMLPEQPPAFRYLSSYWLYVEEGDEAFTPHGPTGYWESWITTWLSQQFDENDLFIDIGANVGYYTLMGEKHGIPTYAFEPNKTVYDLLRKSLRKNHARNTFAYPQAIGSAQKKAGLSVPERHSGGAHIIDGEGVLVTTLDHIERTFVPGNTLIKCDVEGYEPEVWAGMQKMLEKRRVTMCLEWDSSRWPNNGEEFANDLFKQPYVALLDYDGTAKQYLRPVQLQSLVGLQTVIVRNF